MRPSIIGFLTLLVLMCCSFITINKCIDNPNSSDFEKFSDLFPITTIVDFQEELFVKTEELSFKQIPTELSKTILQTADEDEESSFNYAIAKFEIDPNKTWGFIVLNNGVGNSGRSQNYYAYTFNNTGSLLNKELVAASYGWDGGAHLQTGKLEKTNGTYKIKALSEREDENIFLTGEELVFDFQKDGSISKKSKHCFILPPIGEEAITSYKVFDGTNLLINDKSVVQTWKYKDHIERAIAWQDNNGDNYVFFASQDAGIVEKLQFGGKDAAKTLHAVHIVSKNGTNKQLWEMNDFEPTCEFDLFLNYIYRSVELTDLDKNGIKEISFMYSLGCISDVSSVPVKLMLYDNGTKYPLRGTSRNSSDSKEEPSYKVDKAFDKAPSGFLDFAKKQWEKYDIVY